MTGLLQDEIQHSDLYLNSNMIFEKPTNLKGQLLEQESMARHTSWKTGGVADYFYQATEFDDLIAFVAAVPQQMPIIWIGSGSNLLVRDGGIRGVVIAVKSLFNQLELNSTGITVGAGTPCVKAAHFAAQHGWAGLAFLAGIPGTIGGALAMNAGSYGSEIWDYVSQVKTINRAGKCSTRTKDQFDIAYRSVRVATDEWFIDASLVLEKSTRAIASQSIRNLLAKRAEAQPLGQYSCGSVFRNPSNDYAARLIDDCGLKGQTIGGASVSEKHANFIINANHASSADIEQLIQLIQATVFVKHAIQLVPEVRIIGEQTEAVKQ